MRLPQKNLPGCRIRASDLVYPRAKSSPPGVEGLVDPFVSVNDTHTSTVPQPRFAFNIGDNTMPKRPPPILIRHHATGGGPPDDPDGVSLPFPPANSDVAAQAVVPQDTTYRWEFVAVPRPAGGEVRATLRFFSRIKFGRNRSPKARVCPFDEFPEHLANARATVADAPSGGYDLSRYWVASFYLGPEDRIVLPTGSAVPSGMATWKQVPVKVKKKTAT